MNYIKSKLINLPRSFRIWWGRCFVYMLGKFGTDEVATDINLFNELRWWVDNNK